MSVTAARFLKVNSTGRVELELSVPPAVEGGLARRGEIRQVMRDVLAGRTALQEKPAPTFKWVDVIRDGPGKYRALLHAPIAQRYGALAALETTVAVRLERAARKGST